jgi:hypothetical protein
MPEISRFFGIVIRMYLRDHEPAHFHAAYGEHEPLIAIDTLAVLRGWLPRRALALSSSGPSCTARSFAPTGSSRRRGSQPVPSTHSSSEGEDHGLAQDSSRDRALADFRLRLELSDGSVVEREVSGLLTGPVLGQLRDDRALFAAVRAEGGSVAWPNGADLCPDVLVWGGLPPEEAAAPAAQLELSHGPAA